MKFLYRSLFLLSIFTLSISAFSPTFAMANTLSAGENIRCFFNSILFFLPTPDYCLDGTPAPENRVTSSSAASSANATVRANSNVGADANSNVGEDSQSFAQNVQGNQASVQQSTTQTTSQNNSRTATQTSTHVPSNSRSQVASYVSPVSTISTENFVTKAEFETAFQTLRNTIPSTAPVASTVVYSGGSYSNPSPNLATTEQVASITSSQWTTVGGGISYSGGNVGIGTTSPTSKFAVQGDAYIGGNLIATDSLIVNGSTISLIAEDLGAPLGDWKNAGALSYEGTTFGTMSAYLNGYIYRMGGSDSVGDYPNQVDDAFRAKVSADGTLGEWETAGTWHNSFGELRGSGFTDGSRVCYAGGRNPYFWSMVNMVRCLSISPEGTIGDWDTTAGTLPDGGREFGSALYHHGVLYFMGGYESSWAISNEVYYSRRDSNGDYTSWHQADNLPVSRLAPGLAVIGGRLWVFGGDGSEGGGGTNTVYSAEIESDGGLGEWEQEDALPFSYAGRASNGEIPVVNGYVYLAGAGNTYNQTWYAPVQTDGTVGEWSQGPDMGVYEQVVEVNGRIYAVGTSEGFGAHSTAPAKELMVRYLETPRVKSGGSLDLASLTGGFLTGDTGGSLGGSILAGDIHSLGDLNVRGESSFLNGATIGGTLVIQGGTTLATTTSSLLSIGSSMGFGNILSVLASGNVGIGTTTPTLGPLVMGSGAYVTTGGTWTNASDKNLKENIKDVNAQDILSKISELPISQWNYKSESNSTTHIGPMAQDFYRIFGLGGSDTSISTIDPSGLALVGVQALNTNLNDLLLASTSEALLSISSYTANLDSLSTESFAGRFFSSILARVSSWLASAENGITRIFTKEITTDKLCIGSTCVTETEFKEFLESREGYTPTPSGPSASSVSSTPASPVETVEIVDMVEAIEAVEEVDIVEVAEDVNTETPTVEPTPVEDPLLVSAPDVVEPEPVSEPVVTESTPESEPVPEPAPAPVSEAVVAD